MGQFELELCSFCQIFNHIQWSLISSGKASQLCGVFPTTLLEQKSDRVGKVFLRVVVQGKLFRWDAFEAREISFAQASTEVDLAQKVIFILARRQVLSLCEPLTGEVIYLAIDVALVKRYD